ncbi:MAG: hypothetical protein PF450_11755, partial [Bacteroidales bacterium]|nr:hypothetical protein [Bacteroidales bacterium]
MKKVSLFITLSLMLGVLNAQQTGVSITLGIGSYELQDLKNYQDNLIERLPLEVKGFSYYPPYTNVRLNLFKTLPSGLKYGLVYGYSTSGAHANYTDGSGYLNLDQNIVAHQLGASASYRLLYTNFIEVLTYGDLRLAYVRNIAEMNIVANNYFENNQIKLTAISPLAELGIETLLHLKKLSLGLEAGYLYDVGGKFKAGTQSRINP